MPLILPDLDDRRFNDLIEEAKALIPRYNREWTNFNPSDPGITMVELLSWFTDMTLFRLNQVPEENYKKFLTLAGCPWDENKGLEVQIENALRKINDRNRAITTEDFESLAMTAMEDAEKGLAGRAICLNNRDLDYSKATKAVPGHVSIIILTAGETSKGNVASNELKRHVAEFLDKRRLVTTRIHLSPFQNPALELFKKIRLEIRVILESEIDENRFYKKVRSELKRYLDPLVGGRDGRGWPVGRDLYRSEIYQVVEGIAGVDHVEGLSVKTLEPDNPEGDRYVAIGIDEYVKLEYYQLIELAEVYIVGADETQI